MKLRLRGNAIRLRLTRSEVARVAAGETIVEQTQISDEVMFQYMLGPGPVESVTVRLDDHRLSVLAPSIALADWGESDRVALAPSDGAKPRVLIEKDFACLTPRDGGDDADTFKHPRSGIDEC